MKIHSLIPKEAIATLKNFSPPILFPRESSWQAWVISDGLDTGFYAHICFYIYSQVFSHIFHLFQNLEGIKTQALSKSYKIYRLPDSSFVLTSSFSHPFLRLAYRIPFEEVRVCLLDLHSKDLVVLLFNLGERTWKPASSGTQFQEEKQSGRKKPSGISLHP